MAVTSQLKVDLASHHDQVPFQSSFLASTISASFSRATVALVVRSKFAKMHVIPATAITEFARAGG